MGSGARLGKCLLTNVSQFLSKLFLSRFIVKVDTVASTGCLVFLSRLESNL